MKPYRIVCWLLLVLSLSLTEAAAERRVALVIGNSNYEFIPKLRNPRNDAEDIRAKLETLDFEVLGGSDLDRRGLVTALIQFGRAAETSDVAMVYYAGHGLQVDGENYLVPVDAMVEYEAEIDISLVSLTGVMRQLQRGSTTNLIFLDACRDNPFADKLKSSTRSAVPLSKGLAEVKAGSNSFIAFATKPGAVASDGSGRNSPFSSALLKHIDAPGKSVSDLMMDIRNDVLAETGGVQEPWESSSLRSRFSFVPAAAIEQTAPVGLMSKTVPAPVSEKEAYDLAVSIGTCGAFDAFIRRFPDSFFTDLAREQAALACAEETAEGAEETAPSGNGEQVASAGSEEVTLTRSTGADETVNEICTEDADGNSYCASSVLAPQGKNTYDTAMLFDGDPKTAWVEAAEGAGLGESLVLYFSGAREVSGFDILNGYDKDEKTWKNNSRVRAATLELSTGQSFEIELRDLRESDRFSFSRPVKTEWLAITIDSVYEGDRFADTAISELYPVFTD